MGFLGGGSSGSSTTVVNVPGPTAEETELTKQQIELQKLQIEILQESREEQGIAFEFLQESLDELNRLSTEAADDPLTKELQEIQLDIIRRGGKASPEERESIKQATEFALAEGASDIEAFSKQAVTDIRDILAPARGLRPTDTPIVDRAAAVGVEATRQFGQLERNLRGAQATAELNFPLARGEFVAGVAAFQQQLQEGSRNFQQSLRDAAFANQLRLAGLQQEGSLGLLGIAPTGASALASIAAVRAAQTTTTSSFSKSSSPGFLGILGGVGGFLSGVGAVRGF